MKDLGRGTRFLEFDIGWNFDGSITLSQKSHINSMFKRFNLEKATTASIPRDLNIDLDNGKCEDKLADKQVYLSIVGSLVYVALGNRPGIAYAVSALSRYNQEPVTLHFTTAEKVIQYLK